MGAGETIMFYAIQKIPEYNYETRIIAKLDPRLYEKLSNCQDLSISQSLYLSLSLRDRGRADTIITLYQRSKSLPPSFIYKIVQYPEYS